MNSNTHKSIALKFIAQLFLLLSGHSLSLAAPVVVGTAVQSINTNSAGNPNWIFNGNTVKYDSPDGSDIVYLGSSLSTGGAPGGNTRDTLLICDGEVDEMSMASWAQPSGFTGYNLFEMNRYGQLVNLLTTTTSTRSGWTNEPVGCAFNPINGHLYISDDDQMRFFDIDPGPDNQLLTADDIRTSYKSDIAPLGNHDPEGLTFAYDPTDPANASKWALYLVNGVASEIHKVPAKVNGSGNFTGWDIAKSTHFDTFSQGISDPEGIIFDRQNGLYVVGKPQTRMAHIYTNGPLIRTIDISTFNGGAGPKKPAGVTIAPGSSDPLANNIYISARGVDNNADPNENDGAVHELSIAPLDAYPPAVAAGPDMTVFAANEFQLTGAAENAGTVTWSQVPDPRCNGTVSWGVNGNKSAATTAIFDATAEGICLLRLSADSDPNNVYDDVTVQVRQPNSGFSKIYVSPLLSAKVYTQPDNPNSTLLSVANEDIIVFDVASRAWSLYFDGSRVGLGATGLNVDAFKIMADGTILLSTDVEVTLPISDPSVGTVTNTLIDDSDIVRFVPATSCTPSPCLGAQTAGTFEWFFDGSDVGLDTDSEDIDAIGFLPSGALIVSLTGSGSVPGISTIQDEDLIAFTANDLGSATAGVWKMHFDGSDVELADGGDGEDVMGVWIDSNNAVNPDSSDIYLTTKGAFSVSGVSGGGDDIIKCSPSSIGTDTACVYVFIWDGGANGIPTGAAIDGIDLLPDITPDTDTTPPAVTMTAPITNSSVSGTIPVSADASDNIGIIGVQFYLDGAPLGAEDSTAPYAISWNTTAATNGLHSLTAVARDAAGNTATTAGPVSVSVANGDTVPPTVSITAPVSGSTVSGTIQIAANASDNVGVAGVQFRLDGNLIGSEDTTAPYSISWNSTTAAIGEHSLTAVARDTNGNLATSSAIAVNVDNSLATLIFTPTADAGIKNANPANNYGSSQNMGTRASTTNTAENFFLKYTVSGIGSRTIVSAKLRLYNIDSSDKGGDFYRVADNSWTENGITWNNAPAADALPFMSLGSVTANRWYEVDVRPLITGDGIFTLRVQSTSTNWAGFSTKEGAFVPRLEVTIQ